MWSISLKKQDELSKVEKEVGPKNRGPAMWAEIDEVEESKPGSLKCQAAEKLSNLARDEVLSDRDYFRTRLKKDWPHIQKVVMKRIIISTAMKMAAGETIL
ncbi:hypothetical protein U1Q18_011048 [Sarracenia purpurea var. burkii]